MKIWILGIFVLFCVNVNEAIPKNASEESNNNFHRANSQLINSIKWKFSGPMREKIEKTIAVVEEKCPNIKTELNKKFDEIREFADTLETSNKTLCQSFKDNYEIRVKPFVDVVSPCLPEESQKIPELIAKAVGSFVDGACHSTLEQLLEYFNPCQFKKPLDEVKSCVELKQRIEDYTGKYPSNGFICSLIPIGKKCSQERHDASCKNPISKRAISQFFKGLDNATKEICEKINVV